jgi:cell division protein FtsQ
MTQARPKHTTPRGPLTLPVVLFVVMLGATIAGLVWTIEVLSDPAALPIRRVMVEGEFEHLAPEQVQAAVAAAVDAGFFGVDVARIRAALLDEPWIRDASIRRVWPDALHVTIVEQTAVARWGDYGLLNERADIFVPPPPDIPADLVRLDGPLGSELQVLERYHYIADTLATVGLAASAVTLSDREAWTVTTTGGHELLLGRRDLELRLARFLAGYARGLKVAWDRIDHVDLRYTNGFAVGERVSVTRSG